jgi:hypothetical protein
MSDSECGVAGDLSQFNACVGDITPVGLSGFALLALGGHRESNVITH